MPELKWKIIMHAESKQEDRTKWKGEAPTRGEPWSEWDFLRLFHEEAQHLKIISETLTRDLLKTYVASFY